MATKKQIRDGVVCEERSSTRLDLNAITVSQMGGIETNYNHDEDEMMAILSACNRSGHFRSIQVGEEEVGSGHVLEIQYRSSHTDRSTRVYRTLSFREYVAYGRPQALYLTQTESLRTRE